MATVEIEEIAQEPSPPPQLLRKVIQRDEEFEMLEDGEASVETKRLRTDQVAMIVRIEVSLKNSSIVSLEDHSLLTSCSLQNVMKVSEKRQRQLEEMALVLEENNNLYVSVNDLQMRLLQEHHRREDLEVKVLTLETERQQMEAESQ